MTPSKTKISELESRLDKLETKLDMFMQEMRDRDNQRAAEMSEIRTALQSLQSSGRALNIATIIGVAAIVIAGLFK